MSASSQQWAALDSQNERLFDASCPLSAGPAEVTAARPRLRHRRRMTSGAFALRARPARRRATPRET